MEKLDGIDVDSIETSAGPKNATCSFRIAESNEDFEAKLTELAKDNEHLAGFKVKK